MKTVLLALAISVAAAFGFTNKTLAQGVGNTFQISNLQLLGLGEVTVTAPSGSYYASVPGLSTQSVPIPDTATSVTINGQIVPSGLKAVVQLQSGALVVVIWTSPNAIVVLDEGEIL